MSHGAALALTCHFHAPRGSTLTCSRRPLRTDAISYPLKRTMKRADPASAAAPPGGGARAAAPSGQTGCPGLPGAALGGGAPTDPERSW
jgi:hypothetical protein